MRPSTRHCIRTGTRREHFLALCRRLLPQVWCRCSNVVQTGRRARFGRRRRRGCRHRLGRRRRRGVKLASYSSSSSAPDRRRERGGSSRLSNLYRRDAVFFFFVVNKFGGTALSERQRRLACRRAHEFRFNQRDGDFRRVFARRRWRREERSTRSIRRRGNRLWVRRVRRGVHLLRKEKRIQTRRTNRATRAGAPTRTSENSRGATDSCRVDCRVRQPRRGGRLAGSSVRRRRRRTRHVITTES